MICDGVQMARQSKLASIRLGPDFLCVGMQKAGTDFLFDCLNGMEDFRLPLRKEMHHFDERKRLHPGGRQLLLDIANGTREGNYSDDDLFAFFAQLKIKWYNRKSVMPSGRRIKLDPENIGFLRNLCDYVRRGGTDDDYLTLFEPYREFVTGDITPAYSTVSVQRVEHVRQLLPEARIILCVRDPVARLWSQLNMAARRRLRNRLKRQPTKADIEEFQDILSIKRLRKRVERERFLRRSVAVETYRKWVAVFGEDNMLVINFEDLTRKTDPVLDKVSRLFARQPQIKKKIPRNKKANSLKIQIDDERRDLLSSALGDEVLEFQQLFDLHKDRV